MTKAELVTAALTEIGLAESEFDLSPGELSSGASRLDMMMSTWARKGIRIPYNYEGDFGDESGLPDTAFEAVVTNLAKRLAPSYGKAVSPEVHGTAKMSYTSLLQESAAPLTMQFDRMPRGAGYKATDDSITLDTEERYPWEVNGFKDFSGTKTAIQVGDVGTAIRVNLANNVDTGSIISSSIRYRKPKGETGTWTGAVVDGAIEYTTVSNDIDQAGVWYLQGVYDTGTWSGSTEVVSITVEESIEI